MSGRVSLLAIIVVLLPVAALGQARHYSLESTSGLKFHNVIAQPDVHQGKKGLRVIVDSVAISRLPSPAQGQRDPDMIASIEGLEFSNGVIEVEIAGAPGAGSGQGARGFVGIAFRLQGGQTYDAFYLRPTNGRADDQERRNHSTQYISHPDWPWFRLRSETPSKYESYVDLVPDTWTKIRIEVRGAQARLYVHDQTQPTLIVNDLKTGAAAKGGVALWIGPGTVGHFRNLTVTPQ